MEDLSVICQIAPPTFSELMGMDRAFALAVCSRLIPQDDVIARGTFKAIAAAFGGKR